MATTSQVDTVSAVLFRDSDTNVYAVLDGASVPRLPQRLVEEQVENFCLFRGKLEPDMREVAPYLVRLNSGDGFTNWILSEGWGQHWGIFACGVAEIREMRRHFRSLVHVYDADGNPLIFRYYDPRVLQVYLPTCDANEDGILLTDEVGLSGPLASPTAGD